MTEANLTRLVSKLTRMRGAALKVGQFLSIQGIRNHILPFEPPLTHTWVDTHVLPPELDRVFRRVQDSAHYMPNWQMEVCIALTNNPRTESFRYPECNGLVPRAIVALLVCNV